MDVVTLCRAATMSISSGFRAFIPLFMISLAARQGIISTKMLNPLVGPYLAKNDIVFYTLLVLAFFELLFDKVPSMGHFLDAIYFLFRPLFGALAGYSFLNLGDSIANFVVAMVMGVALSLPFNNLKSNIRSFTEEGVFRQFNLYMSLVEDVESIAGTILGIIFPLGGVVVVPAVFYFTTDAFKKWKIKIIADREVDVEVKEEMKMDAEVLEVKKLRKITRRRNK